MFSTLQRPTLEELERRRAMRETFSPPRSSTLQRRESVISRGFNALFRDGRFRRMKRLSLRQQLRGQRRVDCFPKTYMKYELKSQKVFSCTNMIMPALVWF